MKTTPKRLMLIAVLIINLLASLIVAFLLGAAGLAQCFDQYGGSCTPNAGPYIYLVLALIWGIGPFVYFYNRSPEK